MKSRPRSTSSANAAPEERSVLTTLRQIQSGQLAPSSLLAPDRQAVVEHLTAEGYSIAEIAEILKTSERTIARDRKTIREANALARDPQMVEQMMGQLVLEAQNCITRIRRAARDKEAPPAVRIDAEYRVYQILSDLTARLQSVGYLPSASHTIKAELTHQIAESNDPNVLRAEITRLLSIDVGTGDQVTGASPFKNLDHVLSLLPEPRSSEPSTPSPEEKSHGPEKQS